MNEYPNEQDLNKETEKTLREKIERKKNECIFLAFIIIEAKKTFPFLGITPEAYEKIKDVEKEFPGYSTPIDELIEKFKVQGVKVAFGDDPQSGNVFILPAGEENNWEDSLFPQQLKIAEGIDEELKKLILAKTEFERLVAQKK